MTFILFLKKHSIQSYLKQKKDYKTKDKFYLFFFSFSIYKIKNEFKTNFDFDFDFNRIYFKNINIFLLKLENF